ncbi:MULTISPECIES: lysylphosphatidylglycerol synthase transmembrane domain-containing protein [unclassified Micromonospora]|uniref:lysylphosphatidylglycerol synthase transmembrane domain-containing protein n=1 Tax=unclassified Micromonospora TaxID=2617518 RepID=UPI0022B6DADF|nr:MULTISPECIES: lysylphosphatidylglycerol synthase transmembrane domain-containing protein [unclassified Micromonospora]MCZ7423187.1 lysylphosphatidylglycerol synthase transmembrane domain-containing protein [Verrucosispora sp. WMMA2121]WBB90878.1 lysylphosphatidylglycerol synthase transmembrane domain-containing protein [Verrucosispora sp. WMMC514]
MGDEAGGAAPTATSARRSFWGWARLALGVAVLVGLLCWLGTGPFLAGLRLIDAPALAAALAIGVLTTVCAAWRWSLVAGGLGVRLPLREAVAHCYRAIFLNATLPGGILGDVHRAVRHGRDVGDVGRGIRAVVWERMAGQVVLVAFAAVLLFAFPSPVRPFLPVATAVAVAVLVAVVVAARLLPQSGASRWARALGTAVSDVRLGLLGRRTWAGVLLASALAVAGHLATFLVAARTAGSTAPLTLLLPLTLLALLAMGVPANVAGFGPREGVAAWAFAAAGLTAAEGVATATVYGALVLVASLPGAAVLLARRVRVPATV